MIFSVPARLAAVSALAVTLLVGGCNKPKPAEAPAPAAAPASAAAPAMPTAAAPAAAPAVPGFDLAKAPVASPSMGAWPYFSLLDGYQKLTVQNKPGDSHRDFEHDNAFDHYQFFDGTKLIEVQGRLYTARADGTGSSFFQVQKTYEKLVHDMGGLTVWEGSGQVMEDGKIDFADPRHRGSFRRHDEMGVYMVRTPDREIWVEVYKPWDIQPDNYWITIVERKTMEMKAHVLGADEMKSALDKDGHVALYINFDTDKTSIRPDSAPVVAEIVKLLNNNPTLKLTVEGHTDNVGAAPHNQTLSEGRANAVVGALMAQGVAMDRLQPKGFGQTRPLTDNGTEDGRAKNRRVELVKR